MTDYQKYYIAESGDVLKAAENFRRDTRAWRDKAHNFLESIGASSGRISFGGKFFTLKFKDQAPEGFKKPDKHGYQAPYVKNKEWHDKLESFESEPQPRDYMRPVIQCPEMLKFNNGSSCIGNPFKPYQVCWYSLESPLLIIIPDVKKSIKSNESRELICGSDKWVAPKGLREILPEEWDLWVAQHKKETT